VAFLLNIIPVTMIDAFAKGAILQVVLIAALFGLALIYLGRPCKHRQKSGDQLTKVVFSIVEMIIALSPIGLSAPWPSPSGVRPSFAVALLKLILVFYGACWHLCSSCWCQSPGTSVSASSNSAATSSTRY